MAAPQQHTLTNTACTYPTSPAAFSSTAATYGGGQSTLSDDFHGRLSVANDHDISGVVCSPAAVVPQPILTHTVARKTKPCSLCGTAALRTQSSLVPNSPVSPQEQPVVLLHRLEDGLPEGDVDSLRAFGTIRLMPVHRHCDKDKTVIDKQECDKKYQSFTSRVMAPGNLLYKSFKTENIKKSSELSVGDCSYGDLSNSMTDEILRNYSPSDEQHSLVGKLSKKEVKSRVSEVDSQCANKRTDKRVCDKRVTSRPDTVKEEVGVLCKTLASRHSYSLHSTDSLSSSVSPGSEPSPRVPSPQHQTVSLSEPETLDHRASTRSPISFLNNLLPQTSTSSTSDSHQYVSISQSCSNQDNIQLSCSSNSPMSVVCSPLVTLTTTALSSSPQQNLGSPSTISPPESPSSPPSPLSSTLVCSPSACDRENLLSSCSAEVKQPSSPYSPCTLPSLPASPTSLPSSSGTPPSPAPSIDSPPASPAIVSIHQDESSHNNSPRPCTESLSDPTHTEKSNFHIEEANPEDQVNVGGESESESAQNRIRDDIDVLQYDLNPLPSMENAEELSNKSFNSQQEITQMQLASQTTPTPSPQTHETEDVGDTSKNSEVETQAGLYSEDYIESECADREKSTMEGVTSDSSKCFFDSESKSVESEKNSDESRNSLMKLVLKVKHPGNQQLPIVPEKKENNKENGIPKIVLTLRGKGPNKEYSCSNRLRNESESCSSENVNNKKHKSKRNKRQRFKDRERTKKIVKGDKHKRHLELFGEDSNDSFGNTPDNIDDNLSQCKHVEISSNDEQGRRPSLSSSTLEETSSLDDDNRDEPFTPPYEHTSNYIKDVEDGEIIDSPSSPGDESLPRFLASMTPDLTEINTSETKDLPSEEESEETYVQTKFPEASTHDAFNISAKLPDTLRVESKQEGTTVASPVTSPPSEISHQAKEPESQILRSRRNRHVKNTESGRNSDACLWVSFGVNAPLPLPATDLSNLERVFTSKEKTKLKQNENNGSKEHTLPRQSPCLDEEKSVPKATHKEWKEREKNEAIHKVSEESKEKDFDDRNIPAPIEYTDYKTDSSSCCHRAQSSSSHEVCKSTRSRTRNPTPHGSRHRHSRKRPHTRKSVDSTEKVTESEMIPYQHNPVDDSKGQHVSADSCQEKSITESSPLYRTEDMKMESEELSIARESLFDDFLPVHGSTDLHESLCQDVPQRGKEVSRNEVKVKPENTFDLKIEEASDDLYYRPKKIRKLSNSKVTTEHGSERKSLDMPEDKNPLPEANFATPSSAMDVEERKPSPVKCDTSKVKADAVWIPQEELVRRNMEPTSPQDGESSTEQRDHKHRPPTPQEPELVKVEQLSPDEGCKRSAEGRKEDASEKQVIGKNCVPGSEENEKQDMPKREKEKRKKHRKAKRKDNSGSGSRSSVSVLQEAQHRWKAEHEKERGRRLAQEIKGFNWLEEKIKNSSHISPRRAPITPTANPSPREVEPPAKILYTPTAPPSTQSTFGNKEEYSRRNSFSGSTSGIGLKGHLQTAVPPLVPSSKVTALPKHRPSVSTPTTPPCSAPSALCSATAVPSMTVQGALYTCEPPLFRSEHGRAGPNLENCNISLGQEHGHSDKATLYSSTSSTKATLYSLKDNCFEALYDTVSSNPVNYYGSAKSGGIDAQYKIPTTPPICFYGSKKYQEPGSHSAKTSSAGSQAESSVISPSCDSKATKEHQLHTPDSLKPNIYSPRNSDCSEVGHRESDPSSSSHHAGRSAGSQSPQRFSHKQVLLRRAFQEMLKSDANDSLISQTKEKQTITTHVTPIKTEMNKADESKNEKSEIICFTSTQSAPERTSSAIISNLESLSPSEEPSLLSNQFSSETNESCILSKSSETVAVPVKSEADQPHSDPVCTESMSSLSSSMSEDAGRVICKFDSSSKSTKSENDTSIKENHDMETSLQNVNDNINIKNTETSKDLQKSNVTDCVGRGSADIDMEVIKEEICSNIDEKNKKDAEVQPSMLLSVLYKELLKTRQEVEKLRKVQELMLTEKGEKKEDTVEHSGENKTDCEKIEGNSHDNERIIEKRKDHEISDDAELKIDYDEGLYHVNKKSKISIRSDLLPTDDNTALCVIPSDNSNPQSSVSHTHESSSPTLTLAQNNTKISVITLEGSAVPDASHSSQISPAIPARPGLASGISAPPKVTPPLLRGHTRTSPGVASPGAPRISPGILKPGMPSPPNTRASPGTPKSNSGGTITSPGISISPAMTNSPGIPRNSPGAPRSSPGVIRMSPGLTRVNSGVPRSSPGAPILSPVSSKDGFGLMRNTSELPIVNSGLPQMSPTSTPGSGCNPPTNLMIEYPQASSSHSAITTVPPKITTVQPIISPVIPIPRYPQTPITSSPTPVISPNGRGTSCLVSRISPSISKVDSIATVSSSMTDTTLTNKLRSAFGISNSEVDLMPVPVGAKQPLQEPRPQTYLKLVDGQQHTSETPLLLNAVQGVRQAVESTSHGAAPFHKPGCHEDPKMMIKTHQYLAEMKRHAYSTSDLPDHVPSACKQPPPLKPVSALLRRHSDNREIHSMLHQQGMHPSTLKNFGGSIHSSGPAVEHKSANAALNQPQFNSAPYPLPSTGRRRNSENDSSERNRGYQQVVSMGMQPQYPHVPPGSSVYRSLGPDKATIFPVPPTMPTGIRPFRPRTPPAAPRAHQEQFQNENFYRLNFSFFEKIREKFAHPLDNGVNVMERLQPPTTNPDKSMQPQTFAPRVLVRDSIPEAASHIPTTSFPSHFPNPNQVPTNAIPSHHTHFPSTMPSGSSIHHMAQHRLHTAPSQPPSNIQHINPCRSEKFCHNCPQQARYVCSGCKKAWYCSEQCQRDHWSVHSATCAL